ARDNDPYCEATLETLERCRVRHERLDRAELVRRYPQLEPGPVTWGILEPDSGVLMARRAVQAVAAQALSKGVTYLEEAVLPPEQGAKGKGGTVKGEGEELSDRVDEVVKLSSLSTRSGKEILANKFVFACGPWLPKIFPALLGELIYVTRQEVFFFGVPQVDASRFGPERLPAW